MEIGSVGKAVIEKYPSFYVHAAGVRISELSDYHLPHGAIRILASIYLLWCLSAGTLLCAKPYHFLHTKAGQPWPCGDFIRYVLVIDITETGKATFLVFYW